MMDERDKNEILRRAKEIKKLKQPTLKDVFTKGYDLLKETEK